MNSYQVFFRYTFSASEKPSVVLRQINCQKLFDCFSEKITVMFPQFILEHDSKIITEFNKEKKYYEVFGFLLLKAEQNDIDEFYNFHVIDNCISEFLDDFLDLNIYISNIECNVNVKAIS